jgi:hypothetical protein
LDGERIVPSFDERLDQFLRVHGFNERIERCRAHGDKHTLLLLLLLHLLLSDIFGLVQLLFFCVLASVEKSAAKKAEHQTKQKKKITLLPSNTSSLLRERCAVAPLLDHLHVVANDSE